MRIKELETDEEGCINLTEFDQCAVIIDGGKAKVMNLQPFGEATIITQNCKVMRIRFEESETF